MEIHPSAVGTRINKIRLRKGLNMTEFGSLLDTSKGAVNNWEKGKNLPNLERLKKIAELAGISVEELLYGDFNNFIHLIVLNYKDHGKDEITRKTISDLENYGELNDLITFLEKEADDSNLSYDDEERIVTNLESAARNHFFDFATYDVDLFPSYYKDARKEDIKGLKVARNMQHDHEKVKKYNTLIKFIESNVSGMDEIENS